MIKEPTDEKQISDSPTDSGVLYPGGVMHIGAFVDGVARQ